MARKKRAGPWLGERDGNYYAFWYDDAKRETRKLSLRTSDPDKAQDRFAAFLIEGKEIRKPQREALTVAKALDDYLAEHVAKNVTAQRRQREASAHLKAFFDDRPLDEVDIPLSEAYAEARYKGEIGGGARRKDKRGAPSTVRRELNVLVAAANHAMRRKRLAPAGSAKDGAPIALFVALPADTRMTEDEEAPYLTQEELDKLFAASVGQGPDGELEWFIRLAYWTGARKASIENLTSQQIRLPQRRIILQQPGKKATKKRQPIVPILKPMEDPLNALLERANSPRLFVTADVYRPFRKLAKDVGIDDDRAHPHILRHSRATHLLQDGKSLYDVARLLGDTLTTVERVYGHHSHEHLAKNLED